ncbi:MAG: hypothetical protein U0893_00375 [Chloroflexota bacterium]
MSPPAIRALLGLAALLIVGCGYVGGSATAREARPPVPARAAYVAEDGHVYVVPLAGGDAHRISQIAGQVPGETPGREALTGRWPTWSPDASRLAFVRVLLGPMDTMLAAQLWSVAYDGSDPRKVWEADDREPIYLAWSPDGASIAMLVETDTDIELLVIDASGVQQPRKVAQGNPFYFVWSADSKALLLHVGSPAGGGASQPELGILKLGPPDEYRSLGVAPGDFRAPGWSADGRRVAFVANGPDGVAMLSLVSPEGGDVTRLAATTGQTAFALSNDGVRLAWASRSDRDRLAYDGLEVVSTDGKRRAKVTDELVIAFSWSPDNSTLAFVTLDRSAQMFVWNVADAQGENPRRLGPFQPTPDQIRVLAFFDQYAISHGTWAPDGSALVYAVGMPSDQPTFGVSGPGTVKAVALDGKSAPRTLTGGNFVAMPVPAP